MRQKKPIVRTNQAYDSIASPFRHSHMSEHIGGPYGNTLKVYQTPLGYPDLKLKGEYNSAQNPLISRPKVK